VTSRDDESSRATDLLYEAVLCGQFQVGKALPTERDLADALQTSRNSLREALQRMALAGLVRRLRGRGTYVIGRSPIQRIDQPRFFERAFAPSPCAATAEPQFGFRVLSASRLPGSAVLAHLLGHPPGTPVIRLERLVLVAGRPVGHWTAYVPCLSDDDRDLTPWQVPAPFEDLVHRRWPDRPLTEHLALQARWPTPTSARHLQIGSTDPVLVLRRRFVDDEQQVVALCVGHCIEPAASFEVRRPVTTLSPTR
jgi:GntR family transcriptional regulator